MTKCKKCGAAIGFLRAKESEEKGVCVDCNEKRSTKKEKRKKDKLRKAWLYQR